MNTPVQFSDHAIAKQSVSPDEILTTQELMNFLKIKHKKTIYTLIEKGLPYMQVGKKYRYVRTEVLNYLRKNSFAPPARPG